MLDMQSLDMLHWDWTLCLHDPSSTCCLCCWLQELLWRFFLFCLVVGWGEGEGGCCHCCCCLFGMQNAGYQEPWNVLGLDLVPPWSKLNQLLSVLLFTGTFVWRLFSFLFSCFIGCWGFVVVWLIGLFDLVSGWVFLVVRWSFFGGGGWFGFSFYVSPWCNHTHLLGVQHQLLTNLLLCLFCLVALW